MTLLEFLRNELVQALIGIITGVVALLCVHDRAERIAWFALVLAITAIIIAVL